MSIETDDRFEFQKQVTINSEHIDREYNVLVISENDSEVFLLNNLLKNLGNFTVYEQKDIKSSLKIINNTRVDLIIVDDKISSVRDIDIVDRLNKNQVAKSIPKVMLLTQNYKNSNFNQNNYDNLNFIKKPIDTLIFKTRIHSILKNQQESFNSGSLFENMIDKKINEAKEFLKIYKSFLEIDQNILFVYDKKRNQVVETNRHFTNFFGNSIIVNRIISNPKMLKRFVSYVNEPNYLNNHHFSTWIDLIASTKEFNCLITIKSRSKDFTFSVSVNEIRLFDKDMYIIKLSNHILEIQNNRVLNTNHVNIEPTIKQLQLSLNSLNDTKQRVKIEHNIKVLLDELSVQTSYFKRESNHRNDEINLHFVIASILKSRVLGRKTTLNDINVDNNLKLDEDIFYVKVSPNAIKDALISILDNYIYDDKLAIRYYKLDEKLKIEIVSTKAIDTNSNNKFMEKIFNHNETKQEDENELAISKSLQNALNTMNAKLKTYQNNNEKILLITIPLRMA